MDIKNYSGLSFSSCGFPQAIRVLRYSRTEARKIVCFHVRDYHPLGRRFPATSINKQFCNFPRINTRLLPYNTPAQQRKTKSYKAQYPKSKQSTISQSTNEEAFV